MKILVVDPSYFTLPYDEHFCDGLKKNHLELSLLGRPLRDGEKYAQFNFERREFYFTISEKLKNKLPKKIFGAIKGIEYIFNSLKMIFHVYCHKPDVVHFQWCPFPIIDAITFRLLQRQTTIFFTVHDTTPFLGSSTSKLQTMGWSKLYDFCDHIIVHTDKSKADLLQQDIAPEKISIVSHGVLYAQDFLSENDTMLFLNEPNIKHELLIFGEIKPYKGTDILLKALSEITINNPQDWVLRIAGRARMDIEPLKQLAEKSKIQVIWDVRFIPDSEINILFKRAEIIIFPYRNIDASGALMLSIPYGKAMICSEIGLFKELLTHENDALLVEKENVEILSKTLTELMVNPDLRHRLGKNILNLATKTLSWNYIGSQYRSLYQKISSKKNYPHKNQ